MPKASIVETDPPLALLANSDVVADALSALGATIRVHDAYQRLLHKRFEEVVCTDRKAAQKHQKVLLAQPAFQILMIVWKESPVVSDDALKAAFIDREFNDAEPLNCHSLAMRLAEDVADFERQQKRVQSVVSAGELYGYIGREAACRTRARTLRSTDLLHDMMVRLGRRTRDIFTSAIDYDLGPLK